MTANRIVATITIAIGILSLAIPEAQSAEPQRKRMVIKAKNPVDRQARYARERKFEACRATCAERCPR